MDVLRDTLRKCKSRENESPDQRALCLVHENERKRVKRAAETTEQREIRLKKVCERKAKVLSDKHIDVICSHIVDNNCLPKADQKLLNEFCSKVDKFTNNLCPVCNECFPSIEIVQGKCCRCYSKKKDLNKFSVRNNMDPGEVPEELQGLTQVEEMLIVQIFLIVSVYCLRGGQYAYCSNVINFPQDVLEFTTRLPR